MHWLWKTLGILILLMLGTAVVSVIVIMRTWPTPTEEEQFQPIHAVAFFPDGQRFATMNNAGQEGAVQLWDVNTGEELRTIGPSTIVHDVAFSPDGKTLVAAREITVPAGPPHPLALMSAHEFKAGIAVDSDVESSKELLRVGEVAREPAEQPSR